MKEYVIEYLKDSLIQAEDELRNGAIIGSIIINGYKKFEDFDFKNLEKVLEKSYSHRVAVLSLSYIVSDKKIRKKYNGLIKKFIKDPYSSVRKAAAFSEPGFWGLENKKNQLKKIRSLSKDLKKNKLNESYLEGVLLGIGINSLDLDPETYKDILNFYDLVQENYKNEAVIISFCYGLSIFCVVTDNIENGLPILNKILISNSKRVKTSVAESLSFLNGFVSFDRALEIISILISHPAYQKTWPLNLGILLASLNNFKLEDRKNIIKKVSESNIEEPEVLFLLDLLKNSRDPLQVLQDCLESEYSQLKLAALFSTYYAEMHKERLNKKESDFIKFADLCANLLSDPSGSIRSFALYRLLSYSLTLNTDKYVGNFRSHLNDQLQKNRFVSSVAITYLTGLHNPDQLLDVKNELYGTRSPHVQKGVLIGMSMAVNPAINESDTADELILGLLELSGEDTSVGFILAQSSFSNLI